MIAKTSSAWIKDPAEKTKNPRIHPMMRITAIRYSIRLFYNDQIFTGYQIPQTGKAYYVPESFTLIIRGDERN